MLPQTPTTDTALEPAAGDGQPPSSSQPLAASGALAALVTRSRAPVLAVAGTSGKSTTAALLADMLHESGRGVTLGLRESLAMAEALTKEDRAVVEVTPALAATAPEGLALVAVTGLATDELAPGQTVVEVAQALRHAVGCAGQTVVVNADDARALALTTAARAPVQHAALHDRTAHATVREGEVLARDPTAGVERRICRLEDTALGTPQHTTDLVVAVAAALASGATVDDVRRAVLAFQLGRSRLELLGVRSGVRWIDDATATRPGRTVAALGAMSGPTLLIAGGRGGGQPLNRWAEAVGKRATYVLLYGPASDTLAAALGTARSRSTIVRCADLDDAVAASEQLAQPGDTVLFSPSCEPERQAPPSPGERFRDLVTLPGARRAEAA